MFLLHCSPKEGPLPLFNLKTSMPSSHTTTSSRSTPKYLLNLVLIPREVIHQIIPHLRLMLMLLGTIPRKLRDGKRTTGLEHERYRTLRDLRNGRYLVTGSLEFRVGYAVGDHCFR